MVILAVYAAKTKIGKPFSSALLVILFTAIIANLNIIPSASNSIDLYDGIFKYVAPISIFYLLLKVNLTSIKKAGVPMIGLFLIGSAATIIGIFLSWYLFSPEKVLGADAKVLAGMYTGTYIGGSINFNAVALQYHFQEKGILYAGSIAVDNVVSAIWILVTLALPAFLRLFWKAKSTLKPIENISQEGNPEDENIDFISLMWLIFLGISAFYLSNVISVFLPKIPAILTLSTIGILLAQTKFVANLKGSHNLGMYLVLLFLAVIGAYCEISAVAQLKEIGLTLLLFASSTVLIHGILIVLIGGLVYRDWEMIAIASQANVGGVTSAVALAESFNRKDLLLPAILIGTLGNAIGTYVGFLVIYSL
ncbi:MAG: DUF819 family protein [Chryseobacterium sp.]|nr:DUF819 family protein [Chryseobacterium sp.]